MIVSNYSKQPAFGVSVKTNLGKDVLRWWEFEKLRESGNNCRDGAYIYTNEGKIWTKVGYEALIGGKVLSGDSICLFGIGVTKAIKEIANYLTKIANRAGN